MNISDNRPTYVEINLDNITHNIKEIEKVVDKETIIMPVIKANAYGHGSIQLAKHYRDLGIKRFAVSLLNEAMELRNAGIEEPILVLNYTPQSQYKALVENNITQSIYNYNDALVLSQEAMKQDKTAIIHIKLDTGMSRLGFQVDTAANEIEKVSKLKNIMIEGIFTHFAKADETDKTSAKKQYEAFKSVIDELEHKNINIPYKHVSNSAAIIDFKEYNLNIVRPGIMLYGYYPSNEVNLDIVDLKPAMKLISTISNIKTVPKETGISYGHKFITKRDSVIATVPIGYADGYTRLLTGKAEVSIKSKRAPIAGRICMDQFMVDVTDIEGVNIGDRVVLIDECKPNPTVDELAQILGTINYEIVCMMGRRLPRVYKKSGEVIEIIDYLLK